MNPTGIVVMLVIGLLAGWLASFIVGGGGLLKYIVWGILGSAVGGFLLPALGVNIDLGHPIANQVIVAAIGAVVVVLIARLIS